MADSAPHGDPSCSSYRQLHRRQWLLQAGAGAGLMQGVFLTHLAESLARANEKPSRANRNGAAPKVKSLIMLWLQGGPSQLETFDPHPGTAMGGEVNALKTTAGGVSISDLLPRTAEVMHHATLIRSMISKEGDHERATYNMKTGWRPDPTLIHPSIGSILCHQTESNIEIPRHVSILSDQWPARGGYLGSQLDAFKIRDPKDPLPNLKSSVDPKVFEQRMHDLNVLEKEFRRGRLKDLDQGKTLHGVSTQRATTMMSSAQIKAFEVGEESASVRDGFGDTPFGRGCLAAVRLIEQGVTCVEVELNGWDTHAENHLLQSGRCKVLDAALHSLIQLLVDRDLLDQTIVVCGGEFGRTPRINVAGGRDHWPNGFSTVLFGGPFRRGYVHGETTSEIMAEGKDPLDGIKDSVRVEDLHATLLHSFGIDFTEEMITPVGRPMAKSQGRVIEELFA